MRLGAPHGPLRFEKLIARHALHVEAVVLVEWLRYVAQSRGTEAAVTNPIATRSA